MELTVLRNLLSITIVCMVSNIGEWPGCHDCGRMVGRRLVSTERDRGLTPKRRKPCKPVASRRLELVECEETRLIGVNQAGSHPRFRATPKGINGIGQ